MFAAWAIATPYGGTPDEQAHINNAYAVASGQILGDPANVNDVPGVYREIPKSLVRPLCFQFQPAQTASCAPPPVTAGTGGRNDVHAISNVQASREQRRFRRSQGPAGPPTGWRPSTAAPSSSPPVVATKAGSAFFASAVPTVRLNAKFTIQVGGGTGADGMTFALVDSTKAGPTALGGVGGSLGFAGLPGAAVTFVTWPQATVNSNNFVAVATSTLGGALTYVSSTTSVPPLRTGAHAAEVSVSTASNLIVKVDGVQVLDTKVTIPAYALAGFTGATGGRTDVHAFSGIAITY